jgi:AraC-like DNA-binding protein
MRNPFSAAGRGAARPVFVRYVETNLAILLLPILLACAFYVVAEKTIRTAVDEAVLEGMEASATAVDRRLGDIRRAAAQLSIDYKVGYYLNSEGPFTPIETYNLLEVSRMLGSFALGNDLLDHLLIYFSSSDMIAYEAGASSYSSFYGPVFSVRGLSAEAWWEEALSSGDAERRLPGLSVSFDGQVTDSIVTIEPIGQGSYRRGAIVGITSSADLARLLSGLPANYGGWIAVYDDEGKLICATDASLEKASRKEALAIARGPKAKGGEGGKAFRSGGTSYRAFRLRSEVADWTYVAALSEAKVLAGPRWVRNSAAIILLACFLVGFAASFIFARSNARPVGELVSLTLGEGAEDPASNVNGVFRRVEAAIVGMADENKRLEGEVIVAEKASRALFLRSLLDGDLRDSGELAVESSRRGMDLGKGPWAAMVGGLGEGAYDEAARGEFASSLDRVSASFLRPGEFAAIIGPGKAAFVLSPGLADRARAIAETLGAECPQALKGGLSFGLGAAVPEAFLLPLSYAQAESARAAAAWEGSLDLAAYGDSIRGSEECAYPLDVEESIIKAVRSGNIALLRSIALSLPSHPSAGVDIAAGLRCTATRLFAECPREAEGMASRLYPVGATPSSAAIERAVALLEELAAKRERAKRSHKAALVEEIRAFIGAHYPEKDLGLPKIAEALRMSENYLSNLYKEQTGEGVSEAIESMRIAAAKASLESTRDSLDLIAEASGYASSASFRRAFKRVVGLSPSEYRDSRP